MNRAQASITIRAEAATCFDYVTEPENVPRFMAGIAQYQPQSSNHRAKGARFDGVADIAGRKFETVLVIEEWAEGRRMAIGSVGGLKLRSTWDFAANADGTTEVTLVNEYEPPGVFRLMGGLVRSTVQEGTERSLSDLKEQVERV
ncbi:MAG TPA: SRPBCC family protein [Candidatus Solibacter sp.]|nr:SRPBCC family protein [Candidatus Solibacter sp.]